MYQNSSLKYDALRSLNTASLSGAYLAIGTILTYPSQILKITNNSNVDVTISTDGSTDMDFVPANGFVLYDAGTNRGGSGPGCSFPARTQFSAKGAMGTGLIYLTCLYLDNVPKYPPAT